MYLTKTSSYKINRKEKKKKTKIKELDQNWRPVSLLKVDVEIIPKALSKRLKNVLPSRIAHNQPAYVHGRFETKYSRMDQVKFVEDSL